MFGDVGFGVDRPLICLRRLSAPDSAHSVFGCIAVRRSAHGPVLGLRMGGALGFGLYRPHPATGWRQVISGSRPLRTRCRPLASGLPWRITTHSSRTRFAGRLNSGVRPLHTLSGGTEMKIFSLALLAGLLATSSVHAQTRCSTDSFGNTTCRDSYGNTSRTSTDSFGNTTTRDNRGNTVRGSTDSFGNTTYRDNSGNTVRGSTDSFGNRTYRDNGGNTVRSSTDSFGNTTYRDNRGNTVRCSTDSFGNTTCR